MKITDSELYQSVPKAEELWLSRLPPDEKNSGTHILQAV